MLLDQKALRTLITPLLLNADRYEWSTQGLGMLRAYPMLGNKTWRLNLWHSSLKLENVSPIHTHPWHFSSYVLAGSIQNLRYLETEGDMYRKSLVSCGETCGRGPDIPCELELVRSEWCTAGNQYAQRSDEIHETRWSDGTVTINKRLPDPLKKGSATVYWLRAMPFGDAMQRPATADEVALVVAAAREALDAQR